MKKLKRFISDIKRNTYYKKVAITYGIVILLGIVSTLFGMPFWILLIVILVLITDVYFTLNKRY